MWKAKFGKCPTFSGDSLHISGSIMAKDYFYKILDLIMYSEAKSKESELNLSMENPYLILESHLSVSLANKRLVNLIVLFSLARGFKIGCFES